MNDFSVDELDEKRVCGPRDILGAAARPPECFESGEEERAVLLRAHGSP